MGMTEDRARDAKSEAVTWVWSLRPAAGKALAPTEAPPRTLPRPDQHAGACWLLSPCRTFKKL